MTNHFTHEQNIIRSQTQLDNIVHKPTHYLCSKLFAGHVVGSWPMKRKKHLHRIIISIITPFLYKKQSKLTKILTDVSYITFSEPKDVTSGSKEGKSALLLDSRLHEATA